MEGSRWSYVLNPHLLLPWTPAIGQFHFNKTVFLLTQTLIHEPNTYDFLHWVGNIVSILFQLLILMDMPVCHTEVIGTGSLCTYAWSRLKSRHNGDSRSHLQSRGRLSPNTEISRYQVIFFCSLNYSCISKPAFVFLSSAHSPGRLIRIPGSCGGREDGNYRISHPQDSFNGDTPLVQCLQSVYENCSPSFWEEMLMWTPKTRWGCDYSNAFPLGPVE